MASLQKKGRSWYALFSVLDEREENKRKYRVVWKSLSTPHKQEAKIRLAQMETDVHKGTEKVVNRKISFRDFVEKEYLPWAKASKSPRAYMSNVYSCKSLNAFFGLYPLHKITGYLIEQFKIKRKEDKVTDRTINIEITCLKQLFRLAEEWGFNHKNPAATTKKFKEGQRIPRFLSMDEIQKLVDNVSPWGRMYVLIALGTGMRNEEILNLRFENIDLERNIIMVKGDKASGFMVKNRRDRVIPIISDYLAREIRWHMQHLVNYITFEVKKRTPEQQNYLFCDKDGLRINSMRNAFRGAVARAGLKKVTPHTLRHTFGSYLAMNGVDVRTIQEVMGHSSIKTTEIYLHISSEHKQDVIRQAKYSKIFRQFSECNGEKAGRTLTA